MSNEGTERLFFVRGTSMEPVLKTGDRVEVVSVTRQDVRKGDILVFTNVDGQKSIHRVISLLPLQTKGDNCANADLPVLEASPLYRAVSCWRGGIRHRLTYGRMGVLQFRWSQWRRSVLQMVKNVILRLARHNPFRISASRLTSAVFQNRTVYYAGRRPVGWVDQDGWHWMGWAQLYVQQPEITGHP